MIAHRRVDVGELNELAREELRQRDKLGAVELSLAGGAFAVGDRVVVKRNDRRRDVNNGDRGRVTAVDAARCVLTIDFGGRAVALDAAFLMSATRDGEPTLVHAYAITGHIAQGMTVDHALVLADQGINREWAYVALSRGRHSTRLYLSERNDDDRAEFAPTDPEPPDPIARLAASLRDSAAQVLAIDQGRQVGERTDDERVAQLQAQLWAAEARRRSRESGRLHWLPRRLKRAHRDEAAIQDELTQLLRRRAERAHGQRAFDEQPDRRDTLGRESLERSVERERSFGREI